MSKVFIEKINSDNYVFGYDFNDKKIDNFKLLGLIKNSSNEFFKNFVNDVDLIILNINLNKYREIIPYFKDIKKECIIININSYKVDISDGSICNLYDKKFISCNFLLFPRYVILNVIESSNLFCVKLLSTFFKDNNIPLLSLNYEDNNNIFDIYYIFYLIQKAFFKSNDIYLLNPNSIYEHTLCGDIILSRKKIVKKILNIINFVETLNDKTVVNNLIKNNNIVMGSLEFNVELTFDIIYKILLEKIIISLFMEDNLYSLLKIVDVNFTYRLFKEDNIIKYLNDIHNLDMLFLILKEKMKNIVNILEFESITPIKLIQYLAML
ncbi:MAG: hypothetical protein LBC92_05620 [Rickettsiales bacterium]|nr:hypothetical protein [Rickettsiales bacterium]